MVTLLNLNAVNATLFEVCLVALIVAAACYVLGFILGRWRP
ncbi:MAG TPA: hypothetical protein VH475_24045 [Tepidisphaeraceae bacterium]|jgi:hypothetical protein